MGFLSINIPCIRITLDAMTTVRGSFCHYGLANMHKVSNTIYISVIFDFDIGLPENKAFTVFYNGYFSIYVLTISPSPVEIKGGNT